MTSTIYTDRSRIMAKQRCARMRWNEYYEGKDGMGLVPKRKSLHLVIGGAVHAGMEVLLREGQGWLDREVAKLPNNLDQPITRLLNAMFETSGELFQDGNTPARFIEDRAVEAALADFAQEFGEGVELDPEEQAAREAREGQKVLGDGLGLVQPTQTSSLGSPLDSPIVIEFDGMLGLDPIAQDTTGVDLNNSYGGITRTAFQSNDDYLREELAALVEGMVRCWSRRRWRKTLEEFEVLEVEREGAWKLGEVPFENDREWFCLRCGWVGEEPWRMLGNEYCPICHSGGEGTDVPHPYYAYSRAKTAALHFLSRHDALLLERSTGYLYIQSYKTTGSWDRRKELDAQVDMQGLTEAVDIELRLNKWWHEIHDGPTAATNPRVVQSYEVWAWGADTMVKTKAIYNYLASLPSPPSVLGIRYDYLLKGSRKKDKKDITAPDRYVQESILCRAYKQEGITSEDRRWAWTYDWKDEGGKGRRLDYRSWQKAPVWKSMLISSWIDMLDKGEVQEGAMDDGGNLLDALAEQLLPVITVYRNQDDLRDLLEQMEAQEIKVAQDVEEVRRAEREEGEGGKRSALNRLFPQTRSACSYPGICQFRSTPTKPGLCFAGALTAREAEAGGEFVARKPNHPREGGQSNKSGDLVYIEGTK